MVTRKATGGPASLEVELTPWRPNAWLLTVAGATLAGIIFGAGFAAVAGGNAAGGNEYHLWRWQADTLASSVFSLAGIGPDPDESAANQAIEQYFRLTSELRAAVEAEGIDLALVDALTSERAIYENDVERTLERRIGDAVASVGLTRGLPLFGDATITWPPVNIELTSPPQLLVRSPRDRIERSGDTLLKNDLSLREIERIEGDAESDDTVSLVVSIGGLAAYPAIVRDDRSYDSLLDTSAHEWVHHYLAFYPLGETWGDGGDAETLNETTASIAGREIANLVRAAHPVELPEGEDGRAPPAPAPTVDFTRVMRALRLEVDALLAAGDIPGAEARMEEQRLF
ncbi:MAG TPA: hypothetical protein VFK32_02300, partial [Tepidiformaceae bacterium]|nr:hypothetical protein [Tepidiformaceae bacterium]